MQPPGALFFDRMSGQNGVAGSMIVRSGRTASDIQ